MPTFIYLGFFFVPLENFSFIWTALTIIDEGLQILTYTWHSLPLSNEGYLMCHTYNDMGQPSIMVISKDPWHSYLLPSILQWSCFNNLGLSRLRIKPPAISCMLGEKSTTKPPLWCANFWQKMVLWFLRKR